MSSLEPPSPMTAAAAEIEALKIENNSLRNALQAQQVLLDGAMLEASACRAALMEIQQHSQFNVTHTSELQDDVNSLGRPPQLDGTQGSTRYVSLMTPSRLYTRPNIVRSGGGGGGGGGGGSTRSGLQSQVRLQSVSRSGFETSLFSSTISSSSLSSSSKTAKPTGPVLMPSKPDKLDGPKSFSFIQPFGSTTPASNVNENTNDVTRKIVSPRYIPAPLQSLSSQSTTLVTRDEVIIDSRPTPSTPSAVNGNTPFAVNGNSLHSSPLNYYLPYNWPSTVDVSSSTTRRVVMPISESLQKPIPPLETEGEPQPLLSTRRLGRKLESKNEFEK